ncbi:MAG: TIGR00730 family Rossman fold protein [Candidatus Sericytochromatia bacterium]|nr:TIGR00730 family Rossman fold protein [Candidatus Sericytochromatia bacterium]
MQVTGQGITVFCSASTAVAPAYLETARALGTAIAEAGGVVIYGGAHVGCMGSVADAALAAGGRVVGVIPTLLVEKEVAHTGLTELIVVDTMHQRKAIMSERAAAYVVLPGGFGTFEELFEVITWKQLGMHNRPIILVNVAGYYDAILAQVALGIAELVIKPEYGQLFIAVENVVDAMSVLAAAPEPELPIETWF